MQWFNNNFLLGKGIFSLKEISSKHTSIKNTSIKKLTLLEEGTEVDVSNTNKISIEECLGLLNSKLINFDFKK